MRTTITTLVILTLLTPCLGANAEAFTELTHTYTGGDYKAEAFKYRLMKPAKIEQGKKYPLILSLHGAGERGRDNTRQLKFLPEMMAKAEYRKKYPCFLLAPQCRGGKQWVGTPWSRKVSLPMAKQPSHQMRVAVAILLKTIREMPVDTHRVYLTGLSMGGYGTWELAARHPQWFAAVAPLCGGGDEKQAPKLVGKPLWAFHGDRDGAVPVERSRTMIEAIKKAGGKPKYTEYKGAGHGIWTRAYQDPQGVIPWMFQQVNQKASLPGGAAGLAVLTGANSPLRKGERIAFFGDSITQAGVRKGGYVTLIRQGIEKDNADLNVAIIGAGISGHKVPDLQRRIDRDVISKKATVVFIYIGINDVWHSLSGKGTPKAGFETGLRDIIARLTKSGAAVVLATPSVIGEKPDGTNRLDKMLDEYAAIGRKVAADTGAHLCDLRKAFIDYLKTNNADNSHKGVLTGDGVHLNGAGNRFVADRAAEAIAAALRKRK